MRWQLPCGVAAHLGGMCSMTCETSSPGAIAHPHNLQCKTFKAVVLGSRTFACLIADQQLAVPRPCAVLLP